MNGRVAIRLFGDFSLMQDGRLVSGLDSTRLQALLAYLLLHRDAPQLRQYLAFLFWPDSGEAQARTNLRTILHRLRQTWPDVDRYIAVEPKSLAWHTDADFWLDVAEFERHLRQAQAAADSPAVLSHLEQAIALYRDDLLPSCYSDWIVPVRTRLRQAFLEAVEQQAELLYTTGDAPGAIHRYRQLIEADPLQETYYSRLIHLHRATDDRAAALRVYYRCATTLRRELGVAPGEATQAAYRQVLALDSATPGLPLPDAPAETALVGRSVAWEQLRLAWREVVDGRRPPHLVVISGEAGIGKTRLAEELAAWARRQGATTAVAACYAAETQLAFGPVVAWLRALSLDDLAPAWRAELVPLLPDLADAECPMPDPAAFPETWQKGRFYEALARAILGQKQPILLRLEDVQWCDAETLAWLHYLLRAAAEVRLMLVATWRQEETLADHPLHAAWLDWRRQGHLLELPLARLDVDETAALATTLLGESPSPEAAATLYAHTEGNPLFIVETIRSSLHSGIADERLSAGERFAAHLLPVDGEAPAALPPRIQAVLRARLAQLSPEARRLLDVAAVIGRSFTTDILEQAGGIGQDEVFLAVDEMWRRRLVHDREGDVYDFSHDKLRQVAYLDLSPARRRWLHGRVAQALEAQCGGLQPCLLGRVAFHYAAAGQTDKALDYHRQAASAARHVYAFREAAFHLQQAVTLSERIVVADSERAQLYEELGDIHALCGRHDDARQACEMALTFVPPENWLRRATLTYKTANAWLAQYRLDVALSTYEAALALFPALPDVHAAEWKTWLDIRLKQLDVLYYAADLAHMAGMIEETHPLVEAHGNSRQRLQLLQLRAQHESRQSRFRHTARGVSYARTALQLAEELGQAPLLHSSRFGLGFMLLWQNVPDVPAAIHELEQAVAGNEAVGNVPLLDRSLAYLTIAYRLLDDEAKVRELLPRCLAVAESEENALYIGVARANQAWLAHRRRAWEQAAADARFALAQWQHKLVFPFYWLACWPYLAAAVEQADVETALAQAQGMLAPDQHCLPQDVQTALERAVADPALDHFRHALSLARKHNML